MSKKREKALSFEEYLKEKLSAAEYEKLTEWMGIA